MNRRTNGILLLFFLITWQGIQSEILKTKRAFLGMGGGTITVWDKDFRHFYGYRLFSGELFLLHFDIGVCHDSLFGGTKLTYILKYRVLWKNENLVPTADVKDKVPGIFRWKERIGNLGIRYFRKPLLGFEYYLGGGATAHLVSEVITDDQNPIYSDSVGTRISFGGYGEIGLQKEIADHFIVFIEVELNYTRIEPFFFEEVGGGVILFGIRFGN